TAPGSFDGGDVELFHRHHGFKGPPGFIAARLHGLGQRAWSDLPGHAPLVLAPATHAFLPAIAHDGIPVAVGFRLVVSGDLEGKGFAVLEGGAAVEADALNAHEAELDRQDLTRLVGWIVARGKM